MFKPSKQNSNTTVTVTNTQSARQCTSSAAIPTLIIAPITPAYQHRSHSINMSTRTGAQPQVHSTSHSSSAFNSPYPPPFKAPLRRATVHPRRIPLSLRSGQSIPRSSRGPYCAHRTSTLLHFTQAIYLLLSAIFLSRRSVERALVRSSGSVSIPARNDSPFTAPLPALIYNGEHHEAAVVGMCMTEA
ncbi:unnamed protein product [Tilletia laevis]|nr:unnamed protein product [Tilletia laevis]CAD6980087.1 unnamed protein product [Tilletia controversa]